MSDLKDALATLDLDSMNLGSIDGLDPQMARVLKSVQKWSTETVAHQNHSSHGDSSGGQPTKPDKERKLRHAAK